ncbi:uncharacterized protein B4U79_17630 [Dinothrombium tinctorium]|uniref:Tudor domain-containing protein n=1 Tax=Dinothrombium tinctorium TaxID=1965070 RepID=A0A3S3P4B7_9ACAR|nr:uncharacterized protein B4U79_16112 [Dinothrombium tinctorium]RWS10296.1 uncharacterized protein B4U79_17631 [Dinothrombium tinctorium]RWS10303.1 uncharacterized protein B4U79_17630 [Dinothrombium tinctorium]
MASNEARNARRPYEEIVERLQSKLDFLFLQRNELFALINSHIDNVVLRCGDVQQMDKAEFFKHYERTNREIESITDKLLLMKVKLSDFEFEEESSDESALPPNPIQDSNEPLENELRPQNGSLYFTPPENFNIGLNSERSLQSNAPSIAHEEASAIAEAPESFRDNTRESNGSLHNGPVSNHRTPYPLDDELEKYLKFTVKPATISDQEYMSCIITHIVTPSEFYIIILNKDELNHEGSSFVIDDLHEHLQENYNADQHEPPEVRSPASLLGSYWACIYEKDKFWYRAKVIDVQMNDQDANTDYKKWKILVRYIDFGNEEYVTVGDLRPLLPEFFSIPIHAIKCSLAHIRPIGEDWDFNTCNFFMESSGFLKEATVTVFITNRIISDDHSVSFDVLLWNSIVEGNETKDVLVNALLVTKKMAKTSSFDWIKEAERATREKTPPQEAGPRIAAIAAGLRCFDSARFGGSDSVLSRVNQSPSRIFSKHSSLVESRHDENSRSEMLKGAEGGVPPSPKQDDWDPRSEDYYNANNVYSVNPNDPSIATIGYKTQDYNGDYLERDTQIINLIPREDIPENSYILLAITAIDSPFSFHGIPLNNFNSRQKPESLKNLLKISLEASATFRDLQNLSDNMKAYYTNRVAAENFYIFPSEGALIAFKDGEYFKRGRIITFEANEDCVIQCVDTGTMHNSVPRTNVFSLTPDFTLFNSLAIHCRLANIVSQSSGKVNQWSKSEIQVFKSFASGKTFLALVIEHDIRDDIVVVELITLSKDGVELNVSDFLVQRNCALKVTAFVQSQIAQTGSNAQSEQKGRTFVTQNLRIEESEEEEEDETWQSDEDNED